MPTAGPIEVDSAGLLDPGVYSADVPPSHVLPTQQASKPGSNVEVRVVPPDELPNPRPPRVLFAALGDPKLQVVRAVPLDVNVEEGTVVVSWADVEEFGTGDTMSAAIDDFAHALRELYHGLHAKDARLGDDLLRVKRVLGEYIEPRAK